jgi:hypothetical protein
MEVRTFEELGRKMMFYSPKLDNDKEFNNWCKLAPKLIGMGTATYPKNIKDLSKEELYIARKAFFILVSKGEIIVE